MIAGSSSSRTASPGWMMAGSPASLRKKGTTQPMKRWLIPAIALAALAFASAKAFDWRWRRGETTPPAAPAAATFANTVAGVGLVEPSSENIAVSTPVSGLVIAVQVKAGDRVQRGAPLFSLDDRDLKAELALRKTSLEVARSRLARLEHAPRPEEIPERSEEHTSELQSLRHLVCRLL